MPRALAQAAKSARMELQDFLYVASHADVEADGIPTPAFTNDRASKKRLTSAAIIEVLEAAEGKWGRAVAAAKATTAEKPPGKQKSAAPLQAGGGQQLPFFLEHASKLRDTIVTASGASPPKPVARAAAAGRASSRAAAPMTTSAPPAPTHPEPLPTAGRGKDKRKRPPAAEEESRADAEEPAEESVERPIWRIVHGVWQKAPPEAKEAEDTFVLRCEDTRDETKRRVKGKQPMAR